LSSWQSRGTPLPTTRFPGTPVANAKGHILGKSHHLLKVFIVCNAELSFCQRPNRPQEVIGCIKKCGGGI